MKIDNFEIEDWCNKYEHLAKYNFVDICPNSISLNEMFEIVGNKQEYLNYICDKKLNYGDIQGSVRLKTAIKTMYKNIDLDMITVTHGAIGANQLVLQTLVESGDDVVAIVPAYNQYCAIPKSIGAKVDKVLLKEELNWLPSIEEIKQKVNKNTKLICMNNPNNPTGSVIPKEMILKIIDIARKNDTYILVDEVYRGLEHNGIISESIADLYEKGISTSSMSKLFSLAGLRLGWIATRDKILSEIITQREYNIISVGILDDYFSSIAIENKDKLISKNISKINEGKKILSSWLENEKHITCVLPQGATSVLLKYDMKINSIELSKKLFNEAGILFLPGKLIDAEGYLRSGYCGNLKMTEEGLSLFSDWLRDLIKF